MKYWATVLLAAAAAAASGDTKPETKTKKPSLELRATPRTAFSPATVHFTAELTGGDDSETYYCPEIEWEWGEGGKSVHEADCAPYEDGSTKIERRFTASHGYNLAGIYTIKVTLRKASRTIVSQTVRVTVRAGLGDPTQDPNENH